MDWKIGCSGYHYPEWRADFYPADLPQRQWFEYYCARFNTLELNVTYYKFPRVDSLKRWSGRSPEGFFFTVKAPRHITHFKKFRDARKMLDDFYGAVREGLAGKLGCVLFQFPSNFHFDAERLERITALTDAGIRNVLEFRHESWWNPVVYDTLRKANISFCGMSHPSLPDDVIVTTDTLYYRFHGVPHLYSSAYDIHDLEEFAQRVLMTGCRQAFVYFNNTADGNAVANARQLQEISEPVHGAH